MSKVEIYIIGSGGFAKEVATIIRDLDRYDEFCGFLEVDDFPDGEIIMGRPVFREKEFIPSSKAVFVAGIGDPKTREKAINSLPENSSFITLIHPSAIISEWVEVGIGSVICANCVLTTAIRIGRHAQLNLATTIGHDCVIGDYFTTAPAVNISGECEIGDRVYFGTGAATRQGVKLADDVTIGMGAMAVKKISQPGGVYIGIPAKLLSR